jgi:hypothetical protein
MLQAARRMSRAVMIRSSQLRRCASISYSHSIVLGGFELMS